MHALTLKSTYLPPRGMANNDEDGDSDLALKTRKKTSRPPMYKVLLLNDDYTTMDFVIEVLMGIFSKDEIEEIDLMLKIHKDGSAVCGTYIYDIAETKVVQVQNRARKSEFPLRAMVEED